MSTAEKKTLFIFFLIFSSGVPIVGRNLPQLSFIMPPPLIGGVLSDAFVWRLSVCLSRTSGLTREQRGLGRLNWHRGSPRRTWLEHHFQGQKIKGQGHQAALLSAALTRKAATAVSMGTYSAWENTATLRLLGGARGAWAFTGMRRAGHIVSPRAQLVTLAFR